LFFPIIKISIMNFFLIFSLENPLKIVCNSKHLNTKQLQQTFRPGIKLLRAASGQDLRHFTMCDTRGQRA